ncbi:MAG: phosphate acyltransferase [Candidatus Eisenbacteria bacterium]|nr:phosphate acyltransferase [Candidatus Eisenbacteria bacterium]
MRESTRSASASPIRRASDLIERARALAGTGRRHRIAVAAAQDPDVLDALNEALEEGIAEPHLFGDREKILAICRELSLDASRFHIYHVPDPGEAARQAVAFADAGEAEIIMKGFVSSSVIMKAVLSKEFNLRRSDTLSHVAVLDVPGYHKLLSFTDGGVVVRPDFEQKKGILRNYLSVAAALCIDHPKIALLGTPISATLTPDAHAENSKLVSMFTTGEMLGATVDGPMSLDCALSERIAGRYGMKSPVSGDVDAILVNAIEECNIVAKSLIVLAGAIFAGVVVGARLPVSLVSRTDTRENKKASIALASLVAALGDGDIPGKS